MRSPATRPTLSMLHPREICLASTGVLLLGCGGLNDLLTPPRTRHSVDLIFNYLTPLLGCALLLGCSLGMAAARTRPLRLGVGALSILALLVGVGWSALAAFGDLAGQSRPACTVGESPQQDGWYRCVASPLADRLQLPIHLAVAALLICCLPWRWLLGRRLLWLRIIVAGWLALWVLALVFRATVEHPAVRGLTGAALVLGALWWATRSYGPRVRAPSRRSRGDRLHLGAIARHLHASRLGSTRPMHDREGSPWGRDYRARGASRRRGHAAQEGGA